MEEKLQFYFHVQNIPYVKTIPEGSASWLSFAWFS